jgi:Protein of unknown function (DUF3011)
MRFSTYMRFLGFAFALLLLPSMAAAQKSIKCESNHGQRVYCGHYDFNQVQLDRRISGSPCIQGKSWGVDRDGLWVDRGCRAYFSILRSPRGDRDRHDDAAAGDAHTDSHRDAPDNGWWTPDRNDTWPPRGDWHGGHWESGGACFYKDRDYGSSFFCIHRGQERQSLGSYGDDISSIRLFGGARVIVFDDRDFSGARQTLMRDVSDLRQIPVRQKPGHTWNNRISSVRVQ